MAEKRPEFVFTVNREHRSTSSHSDQKLKLPLQAVWKVAWAGYTCSARTATSGKSLLLVSSISTSYGWGHVSESAPLSGIPGIAVVGSERFPKADRFSFRFDSAADTNTAAAVIDEIFGSRRLAFVDRLYRDGNGEGAGIVAVRDGDAFLAMSGGSVWVSAWAAISREELISYLTLCMRFHRMDSGKPFTISQPIDATYLMAPYNPSGRINRASWSSFRNEMAFRLGRPTYLADLLRPFTPAALVARVLKLWRKLTN